MTSIIRKVEYMYSDTPSYPIQSINQSIIETPL